MFKTVIWATDGSQCADRALDLVRSLAAEPDADLHIVHVVEKLATGGMASPDRIVDERAIETRVRDQTRQLREDGARCTLHVVSAGAGHVAKRIAELADETGADVIIVGTRGHSRIIGMVVGSVTQGLLHTAACPVLAVPPGVAREPDEASVIAVAHA